MTALDLIDRKIVAQLMEDATLPVARIAERVGLSQTPCWKRIQKLEASGVIARRVALADPQALGLGLTVFVTLEAADQTPDWRARFCAAIEASPEVMELWRVAGQGDYLLRLTLPDMARFDAFCTRLTAAVPIRKITSHMALEPIKHTTAYPVDLQGP
ncbi:transcriptional regulator [Rhodobacter xanthinilyticus]|uniref:Transcriptional regulator n=1 Tax=Rhodobacter xanthinilyticus TaxID=1850250 RepID=A0A1D9MFJ4_9RHOB|nr:Lrp/AsnC family transcriptional regulator [Rhodobacter xanthinilyticus]AOZ70539.1 transcriptional regulator [Rhodobacter xanthinilyticus]